MIRFQNMRPNIHKFINNFYCLTCEHMFSSHPAIPFVFIPRSNELTRDPPELVQHFVYRGSSQRRKSAACPEFDMVWQYRSPIPVGKRGVISSLKWFLPAVAMCKGGGGSAPCGSFLLKRSFIDSLSLCPSLSLTNADEVTKVDILCALGWDAQRPRLAC